MPRETPRIIPEGDEPVFRVVLSTGNPREDSGADGSHGASLGKRARRPTESDVWTPIRYSTDDKPIVPPTAKAVRAVLRRAMKPDEQALKYRDSWPEGERLAHPLPHLAGKLWSLPEWHKIRSLTDLVAFAIELVAWNGMEVCGQSIGLGVSRHCMGSITAALNGYPFSDSIAARYISPIFRRLLDPPVTPSWYFRLMEEYRQAKRRRPLLFPRGIPMPFRHAPTAGVGWNALEAWALTAYLVQFDQPRREGEKPPLEPHGPLKPDRDRLVGLVDHAVRRLKALVRRPPLDAPGAFEFQELCGPLRRRLLWNATDWRAPLDSRRFCRDQLLRLDRALKPRIPPREMVSVWYDHERPYEQILGAVQKVWKATRDHGVEKERREQLEAEQWSLRPMESNPMWNARLERMWRRCGDLRTAKAHDVAARIMCLLYNLDLEPQRFRELLGKIELGVPYLIQWQQVSSNPYATRIPLTPPLHL